MERTFVEPEIGASVDKDKLIEETSQHLLKTPFVQDLIKQQKGPLENLESEEDYKDSSEDEEEDVGSPEEDEEDDESNEAIDMIMNEDRFMEEITLDPSDFADPTAVQAFCDALFYDEIPSCTTPGLVDAIRDIDCSGDGYPITVSSEAFDQWTGMSKEVCMKFDEYADDDRELFEEEMMEQKDEKSYLYYNLLDIADYANNEMHRYTKRDDAVTSHQIRADMKRKFPEFSEETVNEVRNKYLKYDPEYRALEEEYVKLEDQIAECEEEEEEVESRFKFLLVVMDSYADIVEQCKVDHEKYTRLIEQSDTIYCERISPADQIHSEYGKYCIHLSPEKERVDSEEIAAKIFPDIDGLDEIVNKIYNMTELMYIGIKELCELFPDDTPAYMEVVNLNDIKVIWTLNVPHLSATAITTAITTSLSIYFSIYPIDAYRINNIFCSVVDVVVYCLCTIITV